MKLWQAATCTGVVVAFAIVFALNQAAPGFTDPDVYYHMKMAQLIAERGLIRDFVWLPYTTLAEHFTDQHVVLHLVLIPFVTVLPPLLGTKICTVLLAIATLVVIALCLKKLQLRWWWLGTIILALTTPWTFRLQLVKATPLAIMLLFCAIVCVVQRRYVWLGIISWLYVWVHGGFSLLILLASCWMISQLPFMAWRRHNWRQWRQLFLPLGVVSVGIVLGLMINPFFPDNLWFYWDQLVQIGIINYKEKIGVGSEWYPYNAAQLLFGSGVVVASAIAGLSVAVIRRQRLTALHLFTFLLAIGSVILTLKSRRYVEYAGPSLALLAVVWWNDVNVSWVRLEQWLRRPWLQQAAGVATGFFVVIIITAITLNDLSLNRSDLTNADQPGQLAAAMHFLDAQAIPGDKVLHSDWDDFPLLFYYSDKVYYMAGLDPTFLYRGDPDRYWLWVNITTGQFQGDMDAALAKLGVRYAFITKDHPSMYRLVEHAKSARVIYSDEAADVFIVEP